MRIKKQFSTFANCMKAKNITVMLLTGRGVTGSAIPVQRATDTATATATVKAAVRHAVSDRRSLCATPTPLAARASVMPKNLVFTPPTDYQLVTQYGRFHAPSRCQCNSHSFIFSDRRSQRPQQLLQSRNTANAVLWLFYSQYQ